MNIYIIFFCTICGLLSWVTLFRKQAYPFSFYPMYSTPHSVDQISVFRLALEKKDGTVAWWQSEFYRYPEYLGRKLQQIKNAGSDDIKKSTLLKLEQKRLLLIALQIIEKEEGNSDAYNAFRIIQRTTAADLQPVDEIIEIIPITRLKNGA
jgi:hypothetical protein